MKQVILLTKGDYFNYSGIHLELEFRNQSDDGTTGAEKFLRNVSNRVWDTLTTRYLFSDDEVLKTEEQIERYKRALCYQVEYVLEHGEDTSKSYKIAPMAYVIFQNLGLCNIQYGKKKSLWR